MIGRPSSFPSISFGRVSTLGFPVIGIALLGSLLARPDALLAQNVALEASPVQNSAVDQEPTQTVEPAVLTLDEALRRTLALHPAVRQTEARLGQRTAEERILRSDRLPMIDYSLAPGFDPQSNRDASMQATVTARQMVWDFGENRAQRRAASQRIERERYLFLSSAEMVAAELSGYFVALAKWQAAVQASDQQIETLDLVRGRIERRIAAGLADVSDLKRADVALERARIERAQNLTYVTLQANNIRMLSHSEMPPQANIDQAEALLFHLAQQVQWDNVPDIAAARAEWDAAQQEKQAVRAGRLPGISVGVTNSSFLLTKDAAGKGGPDLTNRTRFGLFLTGRFSLGGRMGHQIKAAEANALSAQSGYEDQKLRLQLNLAAFERDVEDAEARLAGAEKIERTLGEARDLYWQEYILSKRRLTEVFDIEQEIYQARVAKLTARESRLRATASILGATGRLVDHIMTGPKHD